LYHSGQIEGKPEYAESDDVRNVSQKAQLDLLRQAAPSRENPILVNIMHPESNLHAMTAIGMDQEAVTLINTATGGVERIPIADFEKLVVGVYLPKSE
jgi:predicted double-glycine peptidase